MVVAGLAWAETSPYYIGLSQALTLDSNVLRVDENQPVPAGLSSKDTVSSTTLLGGFDQPFGRQRAYANAALRDTRYSKNERFDNRGYSLATGLDWSTVERISGNVTLSSNRSLQRFNTEEIGVLTEKNLETASVLAASVAVGGVTEYSFDANVVRRVVKNSLDLPVVKTREFEQDNVGIGGRWRPTSATTVRLGIGAAEGRYPKYIRNPDGSYRPDRFKRSDIEVSGSIRPTGASSFDARLAAGRTSYDLNTARDFTGVTGAITWNWQPSGKLRFATTLSRDTGTDSYKSQFNPTTTVNTDYSRLLTTLRMQGSWEATAKIAVSGSLGYTQRNLVSTVALGSFPVDARGKDRTTIATFGVRWAPLRYLLTGCDASAERRSADGQLSNNLRATSVGCYAQVTLQ